MRSTAAMAAVLVVVVGTIATTLAQPKDKEPPADRGSLIYGKGESLWRVAVNARGVHGDPVEIAALGFAASKVTRLHADQAGGAFLVSTDDGGHYWVAVSTEVGKVAVVRHVCAGDATMSADGRCVLCQTADHKVTLERLLPTPMKMNLAIEGSFVTLAGDRTDRVVAVTKKGVEGISMSTPRTREMLAAIKPSSHLLVAPNGKRAVAVFEDGKGSALFGFVFDGKGVQRKLVIEATPVAWSRDSRWLVVTKQSRACVIRAVGGQYRCFDNFRGLGLAPDQKDVLLAQGSVSSTSLYHADLGGAHSAKPVLLMRNAQGAALWLP